MEDESRPRHKRKFGFTLVEMIAVLVIIGVLAAFALPRFINIETHARQSSVSAVAAALNAATAINFAKRKANPSQGQALLNCTTAANLLPGSILPTGYSITLQVITADTEIICTAFDTSTGVSDNFVGLGIS